MKYFNKKFDNNDLLSKKNMIQTEGQFNLSLSNITYQPKKTEIVNGEENTTNELVTVEFIDRQYNEYASVRYYSYLFNNLNNLLEYMIDKNVFIIRNNFNVDKWQQLSIEEKVNLLKTYDINNDIKIGIKIKMNVSAMGREFYNAEISENTDYEVKEQEAKKYIKEQAYREYEENDMPF